MDNEKFLNHVSPSLLPPPLLCRRPLEAAGLAKRILIIYHQIREYGSNEEKTAIRNEENAMNTVEEYRRYILRIILCMGNAVGMKKAQRIC